MTHAKPDQTLRHTLVAVFGFGVALSCGFFWKVGTHAGVSVSFGAALAFTNLLVLARTVQNLLRGVSGTWVAVAFFKFVLLLGATYLLIDSGAASPLYLAIGLGALPLGIFVGSLVSPLLFPPAPPNQGEPGGDNSIHSDSNDGQKNDSTLSRSGLLGRGALSGPHGENHA